MSPAAALTSALAAPDPWLTSVAGSIRAALADGATRIADEAGLLVLVRPDGRHLTVAPHTVEQLAEAGLLPPLPGAAPEAAEPEEPDDPVEFAEREAIMNEEPPPKGTPEYARWYGDRTLLALARNRATRAGLNPALALPSCFAGEPHRTPPKGSYCSACSGRRWWFPRQPKADGTGPSADWRCAACRPPARLPEDQLVRAET
jgi:hypothetical protein